METAYFKVPQSYGMFLYYKVIGGTGKTVEGYMEEIDFLPKNPVISILHNNIFSEKGTWTIYKTEIPISKDEYNSAFVEAMSLDFVTN